MNNYQEEYKQLQTYRQKLNINMTLKRTNIYNFFNSINIDMSNISRNLSKSVTVYQAPLEKIHGTKLVNWPIKNGAEIYIDNDYITNKNNHKIINCQLTHELLHTISELRNPNQNFFGHQLEFDTTTQNYKPNIYTGINEATTQMFTEMIENTELTETEDYLYFLKKTMEKLANIIGIDKLASQYVNNDRNFEAEFNKITNGKLDTFATMNFDTFATIMNSIYNISKRQKYETISEKEKEMLQIQKQEINKIIILLSNKINQYQNTEPETEERKR